jgi:hypothetical protein
VPAGVRYGPSPQLPDAFVKQFIGHWLRHPGVASPQTMNDSGSTSYGDLQALLVQIGAEKGAHEVHAMYLGALTSTLVAVDPIKLFYAILEGAASEPQGIAETNAAIGTVFGYWNTIVAAREAGEVHFAPGAPVINETSGRDELLAFAQRRAKEIHAYALGVAVAEDDLSEWSDTARESFDLLTEQEGAFERYAALLTPRGDSSPAYVLGLGPMLAELSGLCETMIKELIERNDATRISTLIAMQNGDRDETSGATSAPKIGRNEPCPCGSGKKWKRCCGSPERAL